MNRISTHVLDVAQGRPGAGVAVRLERCEASNTWRVLAEQRTGPDGRCGQLLPANENLAVGLYRLTYDTAAYFSSLGIATLYPFVQVTFEVRSADSHFHLPLLLSPNFYTTYRGV